MGRNSKSITKYITSNQNQRICGSCINDGTKGFKNDFQTYLTAITTEAGLSFLGLGDPSFPTWGQILHDANTFGAAARGLWWWIVPPGVMIAITGLAFVFIGNALDSIINPKLKR